VRDTAGGVVRTINAGSMGVGPQKMSWDGLTDTGATAVPGEYSIEIQALDFQGQSIAAGVQRSGLVDAVQMASGTVQLMVGGLAGNISDVTAIRL